MLIKVIKPVVYLVIIINLVIAFFLKENQKRHQLRLLRQLLY